MCCSNSLPVMKLGAFPQSHGMVLGFGFQQEMSLPFHIHFLIHLICRSCSASFWISFWGIAPCVAVHSVSQWEEGNSEASYGLELVTDLSGHVPDD